MPGKYLEFAKAGRYVVPVELSFIPCNISDGILGSEALTSKWVQPHHWKEIKALLKPAIESCTSFTSDNPSKSCTVSFGHEIGLGYVLCAEVTKEKLFHSVLDVKKNCWTDDEGEFDEVDELRSTLRDFGGSHKGHRQTKYHIKACVIKRTSTSGTSNMNDTKKLKKELGFKGDDLKSYLQSNSPSNVSTQHTSSIHDKEWQDRFGFESLVGDDLCTGKDNRFLRDIPEALDMEQIRSRTGGTYYEERDDEDSNDGFIESDLLHKKDSDVSDDDDSLPDLETNLNIERLNLKEQAKKNKKKSDGSLKKSTSLFPRNQNEKSLTTTQGIDKNGNLNDSRRLKLINPVDDVFGNLIGASVSESLKSKHNLTGKTRKRKASTPVPGSPKKILDQENISSVTVGDEPKSVQDILNDNQSGKVNVSETLVESLQQNSPKVKVNKTKTTRGRGIKTKKIKSTNDKSSSDINSRIDYATIGEKASKDVFYENTYPKELNVRKNTSKPVRRNQRIPTLVPEVPISRDFVQDLIPNHLDLEYDLDMPVLSPNEQTASEDKESNNISAHQEKSSRVKHEPVSPKQKRKKNPPAALKKSPAKRRKKVDKAVSAKFDSNETSKNISSVESDNSNEKIAQKDRTEAEATTNLNSAAAEHDITSMPPPMSLPPRSPRKPVNKTLVPLPTKSNRVQTLQSTSKISTLQLLSHPKTLSAGVILLNNLQNKVMTGEEVSKRLGFKDLSKNRERRSRSPDITSLRTSTKIKRKRSAEGSDGEIDEDQDSNDLAEGESNLREILDRACSSDTHNDNYVPNGDAYDLTQSSQCFRGIVKDYPDKSRNWKIHSKIIEDLSFGKLVSHFLGIRPTLRQIFEGQRQSLRNEIYLTGQPGRRQLQEMNVSIPFDHDQTSSIINMLLDYFLPEPASRPKWTDYINFVLLPEALIHIFAQANNIDYEQADKEMRTQGLYE